jgi:LysR family glycine cleavage system transcriptional activator
LFMQGLRFQLPPPNSLIAFEAAARNLSFTIAASELNVTRVAVSRQIKALEDNIGVMLFHRLHKRLCLTPEGAVYHEAVARALNNVATATTELKRRRANNRVTVTTSVGFSSYWLIPRVGSFRMCHPDVDMRVLVSDAVIDLAKEGVDVAIRYGDGNWPDSRATFLLQEEIFPTCSASYFRNRDKLQKPSDLLNETLLHLEGRYDEQVTWRWWFNKHGVENPKKQTGFAVNSYTHLVQAVLDGQGIALVGPPLLTPHYRSKTLIRPIDVPPVTRRAFYLVLPAVPAFSPAIDAFCQWVINEISQRSD